MSNEYAVYVGLKHDDKTKIADYAVRDPLCFKTIFPEGPAQIDPGSPKPVPEGWLCYDRIFARDAPIVEVELRCKIAHHEGFDFIIVAYETLDRFEGLIRLGYAEEDYCYNGIWTTKTVVDHGNFELRKRHTPLPGALLREVKPSVQADFDSMVT